MGFIINSPYNSGSSKNFKWAASGSSVLSEVGSYHLEFQYLTEITKDPSYLDKVTTEFMVT